MGDNLHKLLGKSVAGRLSILSDVVFVFFGSVERGSCGQTLVRELSFVRSITAVLEGGDVIRRRDRKLWDQGRWNTSL